MKKKIVIGLVLLLFIGVTVIIKNYNFPKRAPKITLEINGQIFDGTVAFYNWNTNVAGDSHLVDSYLQVAKGSSTIVVDRSSNIQIKVSYTKKNPEFSLAKIVDVNKKEGNIVDLELKDNQFLAPNENGEYYYIGTAKWDDEHIVDYVFKIQVK